MDWLKYSPIILGSLAIFVSLLVLINIWINQTEGQLEQDITQTEARLQQDIIQTEARLQQDIIRTETRLNNRINQLEATVLDRISGLEDSLDALEKSITERGLLAKQDLATP